MVDKVPSIDLDAHISEKDSKIGSTMRARDTVAHGIKSSFLPDKKPRRLMGKAHPTLQRLPNPAWFETGPNKSLKIAQKNGESFAAKAKERGV